MFYRTDDFIHSQRVLWHLEEALPDIQLVYGDAFDTDFARILALVHDDAEIITGDVQLYDKERMEHEELQALAQQEKAAIPKMVQKYGALAQGYDYGKLLLAAKEKEVLEAQFVSFFDKFDGAGEAWHEVMAGNSDFLIPACEHKRDGGYVRRLREFTKKYPAMTAFFERFPQYIPEPFDFTSAVGQGRPHTADSLQNDSGYPPYERWKRTIMKREGVSLLVAKVE